MIADTGAEEAAFRFGTQEGLVIGSRELEITVDLTVKLYQVQARVRESQYGDDVYMVKVVKPEGIGDLIDEEGTLMEHGKFPSDLTEEIEITGVGSSTGIS